MNEQESPYQAAVSLITIAAFMIGIACYMAAHANAPVLSWALYWVATWIYRYIPALSSMHGTEIPFLVAGVAVGCGVWILALPFAPLMAGALGNAMQSRTNQMAVRLKSARERDANQKPRGKRYMAN
jgi:hypothetical protein